jgi:hypothetical protein
MQHIKYCSHAEQLTFNCHKGGVSFRDIRGQLGTIPSIVIFYICACRRRRLFSKLSKITPLTCSPFYQYNVCHDVTYQ